MPPGASRASPGSTIISGVAAALGWHYLVGTALVFVCLPVLTFLAHERWTWS